jgi:catechol 2,3-dioxygenase-like lactoylglutathione lyase family enzyme
MTASAPDLIGLDHYAINVTDLQRAAEWYEKVLGFRVLHKWNTTWMVGRGNIKVGLFFRPKASPQPDVDNTILIQHIAFLVDGDKFSSVHQALKDSGVETEGPDDSGIAYSIFFKDADGHSLEITTYHPAQP